MRTKGYHPFFRMSSLKVKVDEEAIDAERTVRTIDALKRSIFCSPLLEPFLCLITRTIIKDLTDCIQHNCSKQYVQIPAASTEVKLSREQISKMYLLSEYSDRILEYWIEQIWNRICMENQISFTKTSLRDTESSHYFGVYDNHTWLQKTLKLKQTFILETPKITCELIIDKFYLGELRKRLIGSKRE